MPYERELYPAYTRDVFELGAYLDRQLVTLQRVIELAENTIGILVAFRAIGGVQVAWQFDNSTTMDNPGTGRIRLNSAQIGNATSLAISSTDALGRPLDDFINASGAEDTEALPVLLESATGDWAALDVNEVIVAPDRSWRQWNFVVTAGGGNIAQDELTQLRWYGGAAAQVVPNWT